MLPNEDPYAGGQAATSAEQTGMNHREHKERADTQTGGTFGRLMRTVNHFEGEQISRRSKTQRGPSPPHKHTRTHTTHGHTLTVLVAPVPVRTSDHFDALEDAFEDDPLEVLPGCQAHSVMKTGARSCLVGSARSPGSRTANPTSSSTLIFRGRCNPCLTTQQGSHQGPKNLEHLLSESFWEILWSKTTVAVFIFFHD